MAEDLQPLLNSITSHSILMPGEYLGTQSWNCRLLRKNC